MKPWLLLVLIGALCCSVRADSPSIESGFPVFDAYVVICSRNDPKRAPEFKQRLDAASACGHVDPKRAEGIRSSKAYSDAFALNVASFPRESTKEQTAQFCKLVIDNVDEFCATNFGTWIRR